MLRTYFTSAYVYGTQEEPRGKRGRAQVWGKLWQVVCKCASHVWLSPSTFVLIIFLSVTDIHAYASSESKPLLHDQLPCFPLGNQKKWSICTHKWHCASKVYGVLFCMDGDPTIDRTYGYLCFQSRVSAHLQVNTPPILNDSCVIPYAYRWHLRVSTHPFFFWPVNSKHSPVLRLSANTQFAESLGKRLFQAPMGTYLVHYSTTQAGQHTRQSTLGHFFALPAHLLHIAMWPQGWNLTLAGLSQRKHGVVGSTAVDSLQVQLTLYTL